MDCIKWCINDEIAVVRQDRTSCMMNTTFPDSRIDTVMDNLLLAMHAECCRTPDIPYGGRF
jgi:hypothetical protein